jgi:hypothetical protein
MLSMKDTEMKEKATIKKHFRVQISQNGINDIKTNNRKNIKFVNLH